MDTIVKWTKNLIFIILFTALLEMFIPENNLRKYVRIVMGFFIISILLSPISVIFKQDFTQLGKIIPESISSDNWNQINERGNEIGETNQTLLMDYYEDMVGERVREVVNLNYPNYQHNIEVSLDDDYRIKTLRIVLTDLGIDTVKIEPVEVNQDRNGNEDNKTINKNIPSKDINKNNLKYSLSQIFQITQERIEVIFKTGGG